MGRYVIITNIWGYKARRYSTFNTKDWKLNVSYTDHEKVEFDDLDEARDYIKLFEDVCSIYERPELSERKYHSRYSYYKSKDREYIFDSPNKALWGWLMGDRETKKLTWGGDKLENYNNSCDKRQLYDILFRGPDEIPKDYKWDTGEYEGWLQFRWGDGKNAIDYVEKEKPKKELKPIDDEEVIDESIDTSYVDEYEEIENSFIKAEDAEKLKKLIDRW